MCGKHFSYECLSGKFISMHSIWFASQIIANRQIWQVHLHNVSSTQNYHARNFHKFILLLEATNPEILIKH